MTFRYTEWRVWRPTCSADWTDAGLVEVELYDHTGDMGRGAATFDDYEFENLACVNPPLFVNSLPL